VAEFVAKVFASEVLLTNLGGLSFDRQFGPVTLKAMFGAGSTDRLRGPPDNWRSDGEWSAVSIAYKPYAARGTTRENAKRPRPGVRCACVSKQNKKPSMRAISARVLLTGAKRRRAVVHDADQRRPGALLSWLPLQGVDFAHHNFKQRHSPATRFDDRKRRLGRRSWCWACSTIHAARLKSFRYLLTNHCQSDTSVRPIMVFAEATSS